MVEVLKGLTARNLRNMRAFYLAFPIWHALHAKSVLLEKGQLARDQLPTVQKLSVVRSELSWTHYRLVIDLKIGKPAREDIGQMDFYACRNPLY